MSQILLDNVGLEFVIFGAARNLRLSLLQGATGGRILSKKTRGQPVVVKALEDISLDLQSGDRVGLVGHNGAGKSTLLRVLAGIYSPTSGRLSISGKVTPLLHSAPGLEMEDSGYDNIVTCGMLLGMTRTEVLEKAPEIIAFSELGDYIHLPIRTYSSGMLARLSFSIATALEPGILLLDEGIGAADASFGEKASRRVKNLLARTEVLVLASHSDDLIRAWCDKAVLMHHGRILEYGAVEDVLRTYHTQIVAKQRSLSQEQGQ